MIVVLIALAFTAVGLSLTILPIDFINDAIAKAGVTLTREDGWLALAASPVLLIIGSLFAGI
jgi:hypothetical protein